MGLFVWVVGVFFKVFFLQILLLHVERQADLN